MEKIILATRSDKQIYVEGDLCYKTFSRNYSKSDILNESMNHSLVESTGLNVPALMEVNVNDKQWAMVTKYIEGPTLQQLMDQHPEKEDEYLDRFIQIQRKVQATSCPGLKKHDDKMNTKICDTTLSATLRYHLHNKIDSMPHHYSLCHGDFNPSNVIIDKNDNEYILDWSHATEGNFEADCARSYLVFKIEGKDELADKYLKKFCQKAGCSIMDVVQWLPILAASQSVKKRQNEIDTLNKFIYMTDKDLEEAYANI